VATATAVALRVAFRCHDTAQTELSAANYLTFVNDAIDDLVAAGWLEPQSEDETTSMADSTYEYNVPAGYAYVYALIEEDRTTSNLYPFGNAIPKHQWRIALDADGDAEFTFDSDLWRPTDGKKIKVIGQKRPSANLAGATSVVAGMESFIRERATHYAAAHLAGGRSELSTSRERLSETAWRNSEMMLAQHPTEFRVRPGSVYVPGR